MTKIIKYSIIKYKACCVLTLYSNGRNTNARHVFHSEPEGKLFFLGPLREPWAHLVIPF